MISEKILRDLENNGISYKINHSLKNASTFRIGGICSLAVFPKSEGELIKCISLLDGENIPLHIVGKGSNTLFYDGRIESAIVFTAGIDSVTVNGTEICCGAGASLMPLAVLACKQGLTGLEFACGIPGSVGGAVFMNAGAHGGAMENIVEESRAYDRKSGSVITVTDHKFGYRKSVYMSNIYFVCLGATLKLDVGNLEEVRERMRELLESRRQKQPLEYPSAGSYFKRPEGDFAGRLIEVCGLKGTRVGDAQISEKHAGFIINRGNASCDDVLRLEDKVRETVLKKTGVELKREVEFVR